jgi:hypothetical protein
MARLKNKSLLSKLEEELLNKLRTSAAGSNDDDVDPFVRYRRRRMTLNLIADIETLASKKKK